MPYEQMVTDALQRCGYSFNFLKLFPEGKNRKIRKQIPSLSDGGRSPLGSSSEFPEAGRAAVHSDAEQIAGEGGGSTYIYISLPLFTPWSVKFTECRDGWNWNCRSGFLLELPVTFPVIFNNVTVRFFDTYCTSFLQDSCGLPCANQQSLWLPGWQEESGIRKALQGEDLFFLLSPSILQFHYICVYVEIISLPPNICTLFSYFPPA